jgi:uncharacterized protein (TIGR03435 family)
MRLDSRMLMRLARTLAMLCLAISLLRGQTAFEVASIRPSAPHAPSGVSFYPGGRFTASGTTTQQLMKLAYGVRDFQISGTVDWMYSQRFDINAKPAAAVSNDRVPFMVQQLLTDRFKLQFHRETKETQVYILTIGKNGSKLIAAGAVDGGGVRMRGAGRLTGLAATTTQLAMTLSDIRLNGRAVLDRPVLDRTGLDGVYNFALEWTPDGAPDMTGPVEILVIDRLEKPTEN